MTDFSRREILRGAGNGLLPSIFDSNALAQQGSFDPNEIGKKTVSEPFRGVTSDGTVQPGLYSLEKTGLSTVLVVAAARPCWTL